ncbi:MAG: hypothetical protein ACM3OO_04345 [Planctomycetaceae bacterium]
MDREEPSRIEALHEAWHCATLLEEGQPIERVTLDPPRTYWEPPGDERVEAVFVLVPNLALPWHPSPQDQGVLKRLDADVLDEARPTAEAVLDLVDRRGVRSIAEALLGAPARELDGEDVAQLYADAVSGRHVEGDGMHEHEVAEPHFSLTYRHDADQDWHVETAGEEHDHRITIVVEGGRLMVERGPGVESFHHPADPGWEPPQVR